MKKKAMLFWTKLFFNSLIVFIITHVMILPASAALIPADGVYSVQLILEGGSGRAKVESPATLTVQNGEMLASMVWSSPYYTYIEIDGVQYKPVQTKGNATFEVPVSLDTDIHFTAQTIAMSEPHEIEYVLRADSSTLRPQQSPDVELVFLSSLELQYAENFDVDYYEGNYKMITLSDKSRFLVVPENAKIPENLDPDVFMLQQPVKNIYLAATSTMCLFDALGSLDAIRLSGTKADGWYNENARKAMREGTILFAGKYSEPDYEMILSEDCKLAIESTMIGHAPEVKEKLTELGIPVLIDQSSLERHPLGRTEWLKLYAALLDKETEAEEFFNKQVAYLDEAQKNTNTGKTVAFFYITPSGYAIARKSGDYVTKMIELAGGNYIFDDLGDPETSTSTIPLEMEVFYAAAKDADYIIYNSTIDGELRTMDEFLKKNELLADFKAVKEHNVWCTSKNLFQEMTQLGQMIMDIHQMLINEDPNFYDLAFLHRLK